MNIETAFNDLGVNAIVGTEMLDLLGLHTQDLQIPQRFARFQAVIEYFKDLPEDTRRFLVTKATRGKPVNRIDHVFEYVNLLKEKTGYLNQLKDTEEKLDKLKAVGDFESATELEVLKQMLNKKVEDIQETIEIYEK